MRVLTSCTKHEIIDDVEIFRHDVSPPFGMTFFIEVRKTMSNGSEAIFLYSILKAYGFSNKGKTLIESSAESYLLTGQQKSEIENAVSKFLE
jgi:hypothetical protein